MTTYIARRLLQTAFVVLGVSALAFGVMFLAGDPASALIGESSTREQVEELRRELGLDRPWYVQYLDFLGRAVRGDLGPSLRQHQPAVQPVMDRMPATLELTLAALLISIVVGFPIGILSATRRNSWLDNAGMLFALFGQSMPVFWLGIMLILLFGVQWRLLPISGRGGLDHLI